MGKEKGKINFLIGNLFEPVKGTYDLVVVNPPYVKSGDIKDLMEEVKDHDPRLALDGGEDGLFFYRKVLKEAHDYMNEGAHLIMEIGEEQAKDIISIAGDAYELIELKQDYSHKDRILIFLKK